MSCQAILRGWSINKNEKRNCVPIQVDFSGWSSNARMKAALWSCGNLKQRGGLHSSRRQEEWDADERVVDGKKKSCQRGWHWDREDGSARSRQIQLH
jgi:hypothetical protein